MFFLKFLFFTISEGVELVETVEKTGLKYMMAENMCFAPWVMEMKRIYEEGEIGEFIYGEGEYVHNVTFLMKTSDGLPTWRYWWPPSYYLTHPLGALLWIIGKRPRKVTGLTIKDKIEKGEIDIEVGLVECNNGGVLKLLSGFRVKREPVSRWFIIYGSKGYIEINRFPPEGRIHFYKENNPLTNFDVSYEPKMKVLEEKARKSGHSGADFYPVYYFIEAVEKNTEPLIDVYLASEMTLPGILIHFSGLEGGKPLIIPDFKDKNEREKFKNDDRKPSTFPE